MRNTSFTLGEAARLVGVSKATIHRQIKAGKLSAKRLDDGSYSIDPAELHRVHPFRVNGSGEPSVRQSETPSETPRNGGREMELNAELIGARAMIAALERQLADVRVDRDEWREQAKSNQRLLGDLRPVEQRKGFFGRLFG